MKSNKFLCRLVNVAVLSLTLLGVGALGVFGQNSRLMIDSSVLDAGNLSINASIPPGYDWAVLEERIDINVSGGANVVSGGLMQSGGLLEISIPEPQKNVFLVLKLVSGGSQPAAQYTGEDHFKFDAQVTLDLISSVNQPGHLLNRIAYGPTVGTLGEIEKSGIEEYIAHQLNPETISETQWVVLNRTEDGLFEEYQPSEEDILIPRFSQWSYRKGTSEPPSNWKTLNFDDSSWSKGPAGFGYGDRDDNTYFEDMRQTDDNPEGYLTFAIRRKFVLFDKEQIEKLILRVNYDDGFIAWVNGREVARANVGSVSFRAPASDDHEAGDFEEFDITEKLRYFNEGVNVIAIQTHNVSITSSDATMIPELFTRTSLDVPPVDRIAGISSLQQLAHVRGLYAPNQLQAVLGEFWENHFTTDFDKVAEYFEDLENSNGEEAMSRNQARSEASQAEYVEYDFFFQNALGKFEDLLMYSATSVPQLIYLDNVTNTKTGPNENYAREILELFAFGVDNRYSQEDIEELARCFTGWTVRKAWPQDLKSYPESATNPFTETNVKFDEENIVPLSSIWRYSKGTLEPTPDNNGAPTTRWARLGFDDSNWLRGRTGIGYGDADDRTRLTDMRRNYSSVYMRKLFKLESPKDLKNLVFAIDYDDGYVAYINGEEITRSRTMEMAGSPPAFDEFASQNHEARGNYETIPLALFADILNYGDEENVIAVQAHNVSLNSSDLSVLPKIVKRNLVEGSIENGDANGSWAFRFNPDDHDRGEKVLFKDTEWEMTIPSGRRGLDGLKDAQDVIRMMANHISTREFICIKLINKFVSDDITLESYHRGEAPDDLVKLLHECMGVWEKTGGHIREVMAVILDSENRTGPFWANSYYRGKIKTPIEFINSSLRAIEGDVKETSLPRYNDDMGMHLFTRDDPDGWSEYGFDWISTSALLERINFANRLGANSDDDATWSPTEFLEAYDLETAEEIVRFFDKNLFQGTLGEDNIQLFIEYAETNVQGRRRPLTRRYSDYYRRVGGLIGLMLSSPHWQYQ